jgi:hypothetical protein
VAESCTCNRAPESCAATQAEHVRQYASVLVGWSRAYDEAVALTPARLAHVDQSAAAYRSGLRAWGIDPDDRDAVGIVAAVSATHLATMGALIGGAVLASATAKLMVLALPLIEELARG